MVFDENDKGESLGCGRNKRLQPNETIVSLG
jgi:hypothetical protein